MDDPQMMNNINRLVYMANQIARNFTALGTEEAIAATAQHIRDFWDPRMKAQIRSVNETDGDALSPIAHAAIALLRKA
jgi:formate dehydrogenase subunit delta